MVTFDTTVDIPLTDCDGDFCSGTWDTMQSADGISCGANVQVWTQGAGDKARYMIAASAGQGLQSQDWPISEIYVGANASSQLSFFHLVQRKPWSNGRDILVSYTTSMDVVPKLSTGQ